ncbi:NfeD family protein [Myxococcota bacterium]|nr:NfeD family protein [Myxococcota bacterium]MBU1534969.1 NfeD family protein [Myxococcota bacterium]
MLSIYWAALGLGGVFVVLTTILGADSDSDGDGDGGGDFHGDLHGDLHGDFGGADAHGDVGHVDTHIDGHGDSDTSIDGPGVMDVLFLMFSIRFWSFFIAFFGLTGVGLSLIRGGGLITMIFAIIMGLIAGYGVSYLFRFMSRANVSTDVTYGDMIGQTAKVLLPISPEEKGKVRIIVKGQITDMAAYTKEISFAVGDEVTVVSIEDNKVVVSATTKEK